jgi:uncharacterized repeat protein (TIGR02543 family)
MRTPVQWLAGNSDIRLPDGYKEDQVRACSMVIGKHSTFGRATWILGAFLLCLLSPGILARDASAHPYEYAGLVTPKAAAQPGRAFAGRVGHTTGGAGQPGLGLRGSQVITGVVAAADTIPPVIDVWYGHEQSFGQLGTPQEWINILGDVSDAQTGVASLTYSLNGVPGTLPLRWGPDLRRLLDEGDFNVELDKDSLIDGLNTVVITAADGAGNQSTTTVTVAHDSNPVWPLPYSIDWSATPVMTGVVQIVDGLWAAGVDGIRTQRMGYDRVIAIGDTSWDDYEVTIPVTIHAIDEEAYDSPISIGPGLGIILRWLGHTNTPVLCEQPHCGWEPMGGSNWYEWKEYESDRLQLTASPPGETPFTTTVQFEMGHTYWFKARVETNPAGGLYRLKVWEQGGTEPASWMLEKQTQAENLSHGSLLLVAHHVDATFGDVSVIPLKPVLSVTALGSGAVVRSPRQTMYDDGAEVTLTAIADVGWQFSGWSGDLSGDNNPETLIMTGSKAVTASFTLIPSYILTVTTQGSGSVSLTPPGPYAPGQEVTLTAEPDAGWQFDAWSGDLSGVTNPVTLTVTGNHTLTATFKPYHSVFLPLIVK